MINSTIIRFALVGLSNTALGYAVIMLMHYVFGLDPTASNLLGYAAGAILSYLLNRTFTFASDRPHRRAAPRFFAAVAVCYLLNVVVLNLALHALRAPVPAAQAIAVVTYSIAFYLANRLFVFRAPAEKDYS
jgi:putative flippase GtrA